MATKKREDEELLRTDSTYDEADAYRQQAEKAMNDYRTAQFAYDQNLDPAYLAAKESYEKQAAKAAKNTSAQAAKLTGGYGNSYGAVAAQQQYNDAIGKLNEIVPQLEANAYNRYLADQNRNLALADYYTGRSDTAYARAYNEGRDERSDEWEDILHERQQTEWAQSDEARALDLEWQSLTRKRQQEEWSQADEDRLYTLAQIAAENGDYSKLDALGIDTTDLRADMQAERIWRDKERNQQELDWAMDNQERALDQVWTDQQRERQKTEWMQSDEDRALNQIWNEIMQRRQVEEWNQADEDRAYNIALIAAENGDYSKLNALGIDTSDLERKQAADEAWTEKQRARQETEWAQSDEARALDLEWQALSRKRQQEEWNQADEDRAYNIALIAAENGDYSKLNALGIDTSDLERKQAADEAWTEKQRTRQETEWEQADEDRAQAQVWNELLKKRQMAEWDQADEEHAWNIAVTAAEAGDYSKLSSLGVDVSSQQKKANMELALQMAQYGDYSLLEALGVNTSYVRKMQQADVLAAEQTLGTTLSGTYGMQTAGSAGTGAASVSSASGSLEEIARAVLRGDYGNGSARRQALTAAGYDPDAVQAVVNSLLGGSSSGGSSSSGSGSSSGGSRSSGSGSSGSSASSSALSAQEINQLYKNTYQLNNLTPLGSTGDGGVTCRDANGKICYAYYNPDKRKIEVYY